MIGRPAAQRLFAAADAIDTTTRREAAIVGGIVRSVIDHGRLRPDYVRSYTRHIIGEFGMADVDSRLPCNAEIAMVLQRFEANYGRPVLP